MAPWALRVYKLFLLLLLLLIRHMQPQGYDAVNVYKERALLKCFRTYMHTFTIEWIDEASWQAGKNHKGEKQAGAKCLVKLYTIRRTEAKPVTIIINNITND